MATPDEVQNLRVAIVHDWLVGGGAERVVLELHRMFPEAPIYTSYCTPVWRARLDGKVVTGVLQYWPFGKLRKFIPFLRIWWFGRLNLRDYDLVISSSGAEAKGVKTQPATVHINYCHSPTHYYWMRYDEYLKQPGFGAFDWLARWGLKLLVGPLRKWDFKAAQRPNVMLANSTHIQAMIKQYYGRDSVVVHPPVAVEGFAQAQSKQKRGFVIAGRQTPYKRFDIAIEACNQLQLPLTVIGNGPDHKRLQKLAGPTITFLNDISDEQLAEQFAAAQAFIFPVVDDFGITPLESMASGTPVIAYKAGGALDYIVPGVTGEFFTEQTAESLANILQSFNPSQYQPEQLRAKASEFSSSVFIQNMQKVIDNHLQNNRK